MPTSPWFTKILVWVFVYLACWFVSFLAIVGGDMALIPRYFVWGWTFKGGELPWFTWLFSVLLLVSVVALFTVGRWLKRKQKARA